MTKVVSNVVNLPDYRARYDCDAPSCKVKNEVWGSGWICYSSLKDMDDNPCSIPTFCSQDCANEYAKNNYIKPPSPEDLK